MVSKQETVTIADNGTINIPIELLAQYGLKIGDKISLVPTEAGLLIGNSDQLAEQLLDFIGETLTEKGVTLDDLMADRGQIQEELLKEGYAKKYGLDVASSATDKDNNGIDTNGIDSDK